MTDKEGDRVVYPDAPRPVTSLGASLDEIIKNSQKKKKKETKRKRDDDGGGGGDTNANANANGDANADGKAKATDEPSSNSQIAGPAEAPAAKRHAATVQSVTSMRDYYYITSEEEYHRVMSRIFERNLQANNNVFQSIGLQLNSANLRAQRFVIFNSRIPATELADIQRFRRSRAAEAASAALQESGGNASSSSNSNTPNANTTTANTNANTTTTTHPRARARANTSAPHGASSSRRAKHKTTREELDDDLDEYFRLAQEEDE
ncbi:hypothetical protein GL218_01144 [Daldinia childiae]|uniref:uncharacterized protein n=1 Tax=Daldinia childiae TaxID=326645 RepID=UPI0014459797|nr:uncharacterized protein GL218_01144 [Daldinia childiae]KAF3064214.1 hypothetical protein GL218_01144 [Daldinia childiae]